MISRLLLIKRLIDAFNIFKTGGANACFLKVMEKFDIQVLLKDGGITDYQVQNERGSDTYEVLLQEKLIGKFTARPDGGWDVANSSADLDDDLQQRIINQLNGFKS